MPTKTKPTQKPRRDFTPRKTLHQKLSGASKTVLPSTTAVMADYKHGEIIDMKTHETLTPALTGDKSNQQNNNTPHSGENQNLDTPRIAIDTREQRPYEFLPQPNFGDQTSVTVIRSKLDTGDYSIEGFEDRISIERKSVADFLGSITQGRKRFEDELYRLTDIEHRWLLIECDWFEMVTPDGFEVLRNGKKVSHSAVLGTLDWIECDLNIPVHYGGERPYSALWVKRTLSRLWKLYHNPVWTERHNSWVRN